MNDLKLKSFEEYSDVSEKAKPKSYGCVMAFLPTGEYWDKITDMIESKDLYKPEDDPDGFGAETEPHVTILYGIHADVPDKEVKAICSNFKHPEIELSEISLFTNEKFDVVKFDIASADLISMNKELTAVPYTTDYPDYHAHVTIAYVLSGKGKKYEQILKDALKIKADKLVYSKADRTKKTWKFKK